MSGQLIFWPSETAHTINVPVIGDTLPEPTETFKVNLSNASFATISDGQGTGTILDNADPPSRVFVSVAGLDSNDCSNVSTPCRTLDAAVGQVAAEGEVIVIRSGSYAGATITKSVKVNAAAGVVAFSGQPITVNAGGGSTVVLRGLTLKALNPGTGDGVSIQSAGAVFVENCVIDGWDVGIRQQGAAQAFVQDSSLRNNNTGAFATTGQMSIENSSLANNGVGLATATATVAVRGSAVSGNTTGISADSGSSVTVEKSQITNNLTGVTLPAGSLSTLRLSRSVVSGNGLGLDNVGGTIEVSGTNVVRGNTVDTSGPISTVPLQ